MKRILRLGIGYGLVEALKDKYNKDSLIQDLLSGLIVGVSAVPLSMALAIASGVAPQNGLYTAIIAGIIAAFLGGSRHQVTGPTAAFVVLLVPVVLKYGVGGLLLSGFLAGLVLLVAGFLRLGEAIRLIPHPVTTGFTSGIAIVIATIQFKDFFGLSFSHTPETFVDRISQIIFSFPTITMANAAIGIVTLVIIFFLASKSKKIPAPIVALIFVTLAATLVQKYCPFVSFDTIASRFPGGIPQQLPEFKIPWESSFFIFPTWKMVSDILPSALSIAALGAIESLLSASVATGMTRKPFNPNGELIGLGVANLVCPFFGGIPATGAIARTSLGIRFGAKSPISVIVHALFILFVILLLAPLANFLPMAALAAILLFVAYNMAEKHHFMNILKIGPSEDRITLLACFFFTVVFDMTIGVTVGVVLACLLFIRRMMNLGYGKKILIDHQTLPDLPSIPKGVFVYEIGGPLFFGSAQKTFSVMADSADVCVIILDMTNVTSADITGLSALKSAIDDIVDGEKKIGFVLRSDSFHDQLERFFGKEYFQQFPCERTVKELIRKYYQN